MTDAKIVESLKGRRELNINGVDFGRVIAAESYDTSARGYAKNLAKCMLYRFTVSVPEDAVWENTFVYALNFAKRRDYDEIRDTFMKFCPEFTLVNVDRKKDGVLFIPKGFAILGRFFRYLLCGTPQPFMTAVLVTEYNPLRRMLEKSIKWDEVKLFGDFCDAHTSESIATQLAMNGGAKTFTLQHGQYRVLSEGHENADCEAYKNFISDRLLAWGEATRREFEKAGIDGRRIVPCGALKSFSRNRPMPKKENTGVFGVIMCGEAGAETNRNLIKTANGIAAKYGLKYMIRFHPRNPVENYLPLADEKYLSEYVSRIENTAYAEKVDFSLVHMTGVFIEMLSINSPIFIYDDEYLEDVFRIKPFCFNSVESFSEVYDRYSDTDKLRAEQYPYYTFFNNSENLEENYRSAVDALRNEKA